MMKKRVGKIVALVLSIVMVLSIAVPALTAFASSVPGDITKADFPEANGKWQKANDFASLKAMLDNAPRTGDKKDTVYIELSSDIKVPVFENSSLGYYVGAILDINRFSEWTETSWAVGYWTDSKFNDHWATENGFESKVASKFGGTKGLNGPEIPEFIKAVGYDNLAELQKDSYFYKDDTFEHYLEINPENVEDAKKHFGWTDTYEGSVIKYVDKVIEKYTDKSLIIWKNTNVVIDFNGHTVSLDNGIGADGKPNRLSSVFTVNGNLTVFGNGNISGGTGLAADTKLKFDHIYSRESYDDTNFIYKQNSAGAPHTRTDHPYYINWAARFFYLSDAKAVRGGGVYVSDGATFNMYNVNIKDNTTTFQNRDKGKIDEEGNKKEVDPRIAALKPNVPAIAQGGGVYVGKNATFNMYGGTIADNAARSYAYCAIAGGNNDTVAANAQGGGVYLDKGAVMNYKDGDILNNTVYSEIKVNHHANAQGGAIYVANGATLNMTGSLPVVTPSGIQPILPVVAENSAAVVHLNADAHNKNMNLEGGGIYCDGTANIKRAVIVANDFPELSNSNGGKLPKAETSIVTVERGDGSANRGIALAKHDANGNIVTSPTHYDEQYLTEDWHNSNKTVHIHGKNNEYGTSRAVWDTNINSNGAGVYVGANANVIVGEKTLIYDNYDLLTSGYKAFDVSGESDVQNKIRNCTRHSVKDPIYGVPTYEYTYSDKKVINKPNADDANAGDGRTWADSKDDVYLTAGKTLHAGDVLFESKIGVNYYDMIGDGTKDGIGTKSNRVILSSYDKLDKSIWGKTKATPRPSDIQFFFANDNNKNEEADRGEFTKSTVRTNPIHPQTSCELPDSVTNEGAPRIEEKFIDYKVIWDNTNAAAPVIRFGRNQTRNMYMSFDFPEANRNWFAQQAVGGFVPTADNRIQITDFAQEKKSFAMIDHARFDGKSQYTGTITVDLMKPDYRFYKNLAAVSNPANKNTISKTNGVEDNDLYFKNWSFYSSYGYGPETVNFLNNNNTFKIDLKKIINTNINAQPCPTFTAQWYTEDELIDARTRLSNIKAQRVVLANGKEAIRFISLLDGRYGQYDEVGFVFSTTNATPTIEGGYDFSSKSKIYKKVNTTKADGSTQWIDVYYMMHPEKTPAGTMRVDWTEFQNAKGILYTNIIIDDTNRNTVFYATPYAYNADNGTYYYGESRAVSYEYLTQMDAAAANAQ